MKKEEMTFKERLILINKILKDCPYETQKEKIIELFEKTNSRDKKDILMRLIIIDSCYSTNMNRRLFGFEELTELIIKINSSLTKNINIENFLKEKFNSLTSKIGIDKKGNLKGHAFSLITKYIYFETKFNFPIYDSLVFKGLNEEGLITKFQKPSINYFKQLIKIKEKENISFDDLDKYFWVCGKISNGNLSLLINNINSYKKDFLDKLNLNESEFKEKSNEFNKKIAERLILKEIHFKNKKLQQIQKIAFSLKNEKVFGNLY